MVRELDGFLLTRQWRDTPEGVALTFWLASEQGPLRVRYPAERAVMFVERHAPPGDGERVALELTTMWGSPVDALYFDSRRSLLAERERLRQQGHGPLESDVRPCDRFLMERFVTGSCRLRGEPRRRAGFLELVGPSMKPSDYQPRLGVLSFDIETDGIDGPVLSIAAVDASSPGADREWVAMVGAGEPPPGVRLVDSERGLIEAFFELVAERDPDVLIGWNVVEFDLAHLGRRCEELSLRFALGRGGERAAVLAAQSASQLPIPRIPGRAVLDGIGTLKTATFSFESFALDHVAHEILGRGKRIDARAGDPVEEIRRMHRQDKAALAAYNLEDCRLVREIFAATDLLSFAQARQRMTGLPLSRVGGAVAAFDHLYLPRLHRQGCVAVDVGASSERPSSPGGYVLASVPGLYRNVLVLDFKSLYPSIIRTFLIDPLGMAFPGDDAIEGFEGARFSRERHILPRLIETLWEERDAAKKAANEPLSRAIKILMNSFYGVLGTPGCRFFSPRLASSITRRGHEIITRSRDWIEERDLRVIYGDTDSLFVLLGEARSGDECRRLGDELARDLNRWWRERVAAEHDTDSHLEVEHEAHYHRFFMPTLRGSDEGSAKRYAGLVLDGDEPRVVVKGLEAVRTDWTPLARTFQRELLRRVFHDEPFEMWMRDLRRRLFAGELDEQLVYTKRLRRDARDYVRNVPPHVKAALMQERPGRSVSYLWTVRGPQPLDKRSAPIDYHHYAERQLAPAADALLQCLGTSFERVAGQQLELF